MKKDKNPWICLIKESLGKDDWMIFTMTHIVRKTLIGDCMIWAMSEEVHI